MNPLSLLPLFLPLWILAEHRDAVGQARVPAALALGLCLALYALALRAGGGARAPGRTFPPRLAAWTAAAAFVLSFWVPAPLSHVCRVLALGLLLLEWRPDSAPDGIALLLAGAAGCIANALAPWCLVRGYPGAVVGRVLAPLVGLAGVQAAPTQRGLALEAGPTQVLEIGLGWMQIGARPALALAAAAGVLVLAGPRIGVRARDGLGFLAAILLAMGAQAVLGVLLAAERRDPDLLTDPWVRMLAFGAPLLLCAGSLPRRAREWPSTAREIPRVSRWAPAAAAGVGAYLLTLAVFAVGPVRTLPGRVIVDAGHSTWERLDLPLDRASFGTLATYNYSDWLRGMRARWSDVQVLEQPLSAASLADARVLVLKTPTLPYTKAEVAAVHEFVDRGGGLFLVGDHNDVFGMNTILNSVSQRYGVRYRADSVFEIEHVGGQVSDPAVFPPHPLTRLARPMRWMTSCSIEVSGSARPILWLDHGFSDDSDYAENNFMGDTELRSAEHTAPLAQVVVARSGAGRVLAFSDSTLFSNFSVFLPGVRELAFGGIEWLRSRDPFDPWRDPLGWLAALCIAAAVAVAMALRNGIEVAAALFTGLALGLPLADASCARALRSVEHGLDGQEVVFDLVHSAGRLPTWHESHEDAPDDFWSLFLAFQRSGHLMRAAMREDEVLVGRQSVHVWPKRPLDEDHVARLDRYVRDGGVLWVFDDRLALASAANDLLAPFGLELCDPRPDRRWSRDGPFASSVELRRSTRVRGGAPVLLDEEGEVLAAVRQHGDGAVVAVGLAQDLSVSSMGTHTTLAGLRGFELMQAVYRLIDASQGTSSLGRVP